MSVTQIVEKLTQAQPEVVAFDGNLSPETMAALLLHCEKSGIPSEFSFSRLQLSITSLTKISRLQLSSSQRQTQTLSNSLPLCNNLSSLPFLLQTIPSSPTQRPISTNSKPSSKPSPFPTLLSSNQEFGLTESPFQLINFRFDYLLGLSMRESLKWLSDYSLSSIRSS